MANSPTSRRNALTPWWIGLLIIVLAVGYVAYLFTTLDCDIAPVLAFLVLGAVPIVYLVLMYLTFTSQAKDEARSRGPV